MANRLTRQRAMFVAFLLISQVFFLIMFACFAEYDQHSVPRNMALAPQNKNASIDDSKTDILNHAYGMFQDVHVMMFIGFGFLMTFLKRYGFSSLTINLLLAAYTIEWHSILLGLFHLIDHDKFQFGIYEMIYSDLSAAAILISMGAVLGKVSPLQYLIMAFFETFFYTVNEFAFDHLAIADVGGTIMIHLFGAYFGLTIAWIHYRKELADHDNEGSVYHSDLFSMIGTLFLWVYWPSFVAAFAAPADARNRCILHTYLALVACTVVTKAFTVLISRHKKFDMVHVQNATLAGGVAIGAAANLYLTPVGAIVIGMVAGVLSVFGFEYIQPMLRDKLKLHDTCGVNNLHGMPAILGGIVSVIAFAAVNPDIYGTSLPDIAKAMEPGTSYPDAGEEGRSASMQACYQLAGIALTLGIAVVGGAITGGIMKIPIFVIKHDHCFDDAHFFTVPENNYVIANEVEEEEIINLPRPTYIVQR